MEAADGVVLDERRLAVLDLSGVGNLLVSYAVLN